MEGLRKVLALLHRFDGGIIPLYRGKVKRVFGAKKRFYILFTNGGKPGAVISQLTVFFRQALPFHLIRSRRDHLLLKEKAFKNQQNAKRKAPLCKGGRDPPKMPAFLRGPYAGTEGDWGIVLS
ncbi:MAG: hypothetical protein IJU75_03130, partial [Clostridia bacterium]|nr:hypothetical protein [Clostridia bacterium]